MSEKGKIKYYNAQKGNGIIAVEGKDDVLIEPNSFESGTLTKLIKGEFVEFDLMKKKKNMIARNIRKIQAPSHGSHDRKEISRLE